MTRRSPFIFLLLALCSASAIGIAGQDRTSHPIWNYDMSSAPILADPYGQFPARSDIL
jgi:hypothetical protein